MQIYKKLVIRVNLKYKKMQKTGYVNQLPAKGVIDK